MSGQQRQSRLFEIISPKSVLAKGDAMICDCISLLFLLYAGSDDGLVN